MANAGALAGGSIGIAIERVPGLQGWIHPEIVGLLQSMVDSIGPMVQALMESVPALAEIATVPAWTIWGLEALLLTGLAIGGHVLISHCISDGPNPP